MAFRGVRTVRRRRQSDDDGDGKGGGISQAIDDILSGERGDGGKGPSPIGVSRGFEATTQRRYTDQGQYPRVLNMPPISGYAGLPAQQKPRYFKDDEFAPANFHPNVITSLQQKLAAAGLYETNALVVPGDWGEDTAKAFKKLLAYANQHGMTYQAALNHIKSQIEGAGGGPGGTTGAGGGKFRVDEFGNLVPMDAPPARAPLVTRTTDPRTVELVLRETAMNMVGQALSTDQVQGMTAAYNQMEIARQQEAYDKELTGGNVVDIPSPEAFGQAQIEAQQPQEVQNYRGLNYLSNAMQMLGSPAWGLGR